MGLCGKTSAAVSIILVALLIRFSWRDAGEKPQFDQRFDIQEGGRVCFFDLPIDDDEQEDVPSPILFMIHGTGQDADVMKTIFGEEAVARARREGFVVVYPVGIKIRGLQRTWNGGGMSEMSDDGLYANDVAYFSHIVAHLAANFNADPQRVFLSGMSYGGIMTHRLACAWASESHPIHVRAIAPILGALGKMKYDAKCGDEVRLVPFPILYRTFDEDACPYQAWKDAPAHFECDALKDLPALIVNNGRDILMPLGGATLTTIIGSTGLFPPAEYTLRFYAEANGCDYDSHATSRVETLRRVSTEHPDDITTCHSLLNCRSNTTLCVSHNALHEWVSPTNGDERSGFTRWLTSPRAKTMNTSHEILNFFSQYNTH